MDIPNWAKGATTCQRICWVRCDWFHLAIHFCKATLNTKPACMYFNDKRKGTFPDCCQLLMNSKFHWHDLTHTLIRPTLAINYATDCFVCFFQSWSYLLATYVSVVVCNSNDDQMFKRVISKMMFSCSFYAVCLLSMEGICFSYYNIVIIVLLHW